MEVDIVDIKEAIEEFRQRMPLLPLRELFVEAGLLVETLARALKWKVYKELGIEETKKERKVRTEIKEVIEPEPVEEAQSDQIQSDLDWLWSYEAKVGRPKGSKSLLTSKQEKFKEVVPLYKEFKIEDYQKVVSSMDFEALKDFLKQIPDRTERVRYFLAWLYL